MVKLIIYEELCKGCSICIHACPKEILSLSETKLNSKGYQPVQIKDQNACTGCLACARICPDVAIEIEK